MPSPQVCVCVLRCSSALAVRYTATDSWCSSATSWRSGLVEGSGRGTPRVWAGLVSTHSAGLTCQASTKRFAGKQGPCVGRKGTYCACGAGVVPRLHGGYSCTGPSCPLSLGPHSPLAGVRGRFPRRTGPKWAFMVPKAPPPGSPKQHQTVLVFCGWTTGYPGQHAVSTACQRSRQQMLSVVPLYLLARCGVCCHVCCLHFACALLPACPLQTQV